MPRVKIDYVVSFSSEDPEHPANNLLNREVSKKKWLCKKGESSCSVVLQLARAVKISSVHVGVYHAALVEVLVGRSETANEQFQVLVPRSVFLSRSESRGAAAERVRSFGAAQLGAARAQRWDRVRVLCQQPHDKHCQYGLSFIHIEESETSTAAAVPPRLLALGTYSSDEDEFKPGELFAKHRQAPSDGDTQPNTSTNTGAQIRQATSQALRNIPESSTKLIKTPISKPNAKRDTTASAERNADRTRDALLYNDDDGLPHAKIDQLVQRHKHEKQKEDKQPKHDQKDRDKQSDCNQKTKDDTQKQTPKRNKSNSPPRRATPPHRANRNDNPVSEHRNDSERKRRRSNSQEKARSPGGSSSAEPHTLLRDCVLVLSGYENPRRAAVRNLALALGARVRAHWGPDCTHLICAFPNTPKLRSVRAQAGRHTPAVRAEWLDECSRARRRVPWQWHATEREQRRAPAEGERRSESPPPTPLHDSEGDTDDEIEKALQKQKKRRVSTTIPTDTKQKRDDPHPSTDNARIEPKISDSDNEVTEEEDDTIPTTKQFGGSLPDFFDGYTFAIDAEPQDEEQISRYIRAYGGLVLEASSSADFQLCARAAATAHARAAATAHARAASTAHARARPAAWLARCHAARTLLQ